jgi:hypothetical protein
MNSASSVLGQSFGFSNRIGSHALIQAEARLFASSSLDVRSAVHALGGSAVGFMIAASFSNADPDVEMPSWTIATRTELHEESLHEVLRDIVRRHDSLLVKRSGTRESFTSESARGANTSRASHTRGIDEKSLGDILQTLGDEGPDHRAYLFRGLIEPPGAFSTAHIYASSVNVDVELLYGNQRILFGDSDTAGESMESCPASPRTADRVADARSYGQVGRRFVRWAANRLPDIEEWNLEGQWEPLHQRFWIFQVRPSPPDRPVAGIRRRRQARGEGYTTRFVWGQFDVTLTWAEGESAWSGVDRVVLFAPGSDRLALMEQVEGLLLSGSSVLVADADSAFRLSHEPDRLPRSDLRERYMYCHVPADLLAQARQDERIIMISSDGDRCSIWTAPCEV